MADKADDPEIRAKMTEVISLIEHETVHTQLIIADLVTSWAISAANDRESVDHLIELHVDHVKSYISQIREFETFLSTHNDKGSS